MTSNIEIVDLSGTGLPVTETRQASKWIAKAFADAPAEPALAIFFGVASYQENTEMHEAFWAAHLNRVARSGVLLGARDEDGWKGFRCFFSPNSKRSYDPDPESDSDEAWIRFLELTGEEAYMSRISEWGRLTKKTRRELDIETDQFFTTSIIVVDRSHQRKGIGHLLDDATRAIVRKNNSKLIIRIHEHILGFYLAQGYQVLASPTYVLGEAKPFVVHFLLHECQK